MTMDGWTGETIGVRPWMTAASPVLDALEAAGGQVRFVGGCVRAAVMNQPIADVDLCGTLRPTT
jgi:poly(A) polymerase